MVCSNPSNWHLVSTATAHQAIVVYLTVTDSCEGTNKINRVALLSVEFCAAGYFHNG